METQAQTTSAKPLREPWNKGKLIGQKPPLRAKHVWSIRTRLQMEGRTRDLAMFNLAIDSKLRGCDVVALRVEDIAPSGYAVDRTADDHTANVLGGWLLWPRRKGGHASILLFMLGPKCEPAHTSKILSRLPRDLLLLRVKRLPASSDFW